MTTQKTRILLCDDHEVVREGLRGLIARQDGMSVVGEAGTVAEVVEAATRQGPTVKLRVRLDSGESLDAIVAALAHPDPGERVLVEVDPAGVVELR